MIGVRQCICAAALALLAASHGYPKSASTPPRPAPSLYVTYNYGLVARFPPGLTYCPLPNGWIGSDHGTEVYLMPPAACGSSHAFPSSSRHVGSAVPTVGLFYSYNLDDDVSSPDGNLPRHPKSCGGGRGYRLTLLGAMRNACALEHDGTIQVSIEQLYSLSSLQDHKLVLTLRTVVSRFKADMAVFGRIAGAVQLCRPDWEHGSLVSLPCPLQATWW